MMKIKFTYYFEESIEDFIILDAFNFGYVEQLGENHSPMIQIFDDTDKARYFITKLLASIHATGMDLSFIKIVLSWYDILITTLNDYEKYGKLTNINLKGSKKYSNNYVSLEFIN